MKLAVARCPECFLEFALSQEALGELAELTCPRCERVFEPPDENVDSAEGDEEEFLGDDLESEGADEDWGDEEDGIEDDQRGEPHRTFRRRPERSRRNDDRI